MSGPRLPLLDLLSLDCHQIPPLPLHLLRLSSPPLPHLSISIISTSCTTLDPSYPIQLLTPEQPSKVWSSPYTKTCSVRGRYPIDIKVKISVKYAEHGPVFVSSTRLNRICRLLSLRAKGCVGEPCAGFVLRLYGSNLIWIIPAKGSCLPTPTHEDKLNSPQA